MDERAAWPCNKAGEVQGVNTNCGRVVVKYIENNIIPIICIGVLIGLLLITNISWWNVSNSKADLYSRSSYEMWAEKEEWRCRAVSYKNNYEKCFKMYLIERLGGR